MSAIFSQPSCLALEAKGAAPSFFAQTVSGASGGSLTTSTCDRNDRVISTGGGEPGAASVGLGEILRPPVADRGRVRRELGGLLRLEPGGGPS